MLLLLQLPNRLTVKSQKTANLLRKAKNPQRARIQRRLKTQKILRTRKTQRTQRTQRTQKKLNQKEMAMPKSQTEGPDQSPAEETQQPPERAKESARVPK